MSDRTKNLIAIVASLLLHLLIVLGLVIWQSLAAPQGVAEEETPDPPEPEPIEITVNSLLAAANAEAERTPLLIPSEGLTASAEPPKEATFQSDVDMVAGSNLPAAGDVPLPTQEGRETDTVSFEKQSATLDMKGSNPAEPTPMVSPAPSEAPAPTPEPTPVATPTPVPAATPNRQPTAAPQPSLITSEARTNIARLSPPTGDEALEPIFKPTPLPKAEPSPRAAREKPTPIPGVTPMLIASAPTPAPPDLPQPRTRESSYRPELEPTRIEGSISNRGAPGVNALGTPLGRFHKTIRDAVGSRWHLRVKERQDLITIGRTRIRFYITPSGSVQNAEIMANTANDTFASLSLEAVMEAKIPAIPEEITGLLDNGRMEIIYTFDYY